VGSRCQAELQRIDDQVKSLLKTLSDASPSERYDVLRTFKRTVHHIVECIDALNEGDSSLLSAQKSPGIADG
jgi:exonuclease VII small subunit